MRPIQIQTLDGISLAALHWDRQSSKSALLLHMMPATKESFEPLAHELYTQGLNVLAIDFRGHGESSGGDYQTYKNEEHQKYFIDARAALSWLEDTYNSSNIVLVGASIGANIALQCMAHDPLLKRGACLSAGLDYYGVKASEFVTQLKADQSILFVASKDDVRKTGVYIASQAEKLFDLATCKKEKQIYKTGGHGTDMFGSHPDLLDTLIAFLTK